MNLAHRVNNVLTRNLTVKPAASHLQRPVASLSFDDFPRSAWRTGGPMLDRYGVKATYYAAGRFCGQREDGLEYFSVEDLAEIRDAGHEIGCHTFSHEHGPQVASHTLSDDAERNQAFVSDLLGDYQLTSFAYPFGDVSPRTKLLFCDRFASSRGIYPGVNAGIIDLAQLKAVPLERRSWNAATVERLVAQAVARRGWLVFFSHDVSDDPSPYGATPRMLEHALETLSAAAVDVLPVKHALARAVFSEAA